MTKPNIISATNTVERYFAQLNGRQRRLCYNIRTLILSVAPDIVEHLKWDHPTYSRRRDVFWIQADADRWINFGFFQGAKMMVYDPRGMVEGGGQISRHIQLANTRQIDRPYFKMLIKRALEIDELS
jgi:hypothetical protein